MLKKINEEKNIEDISLIIENISREISDIKNNINIILDRIILLEDKVIKSNAISYEIVRKRCLNTELSLDRISDD
tara:strand:+ start:6171 stop:6395 length:225 start_codon:yes stop_codon:yes gene_type:complete